MNKKEMLEMLFRGESSPELTGALIDVLQTPPRVRKIYDVVQWTRAVASKSPNVKAYSNGEYFFVTDGGRIHASPTDLSPGQYTLDRKKLLGTAYRVPDLDRVLGPYDWKELKCRRLNIIPFCKRKTELRCVGYGDLLFNADFYDDLTRLAGRFKLSVQEVNGAPVKIKVDYESGAFGVLMPINMKVKQ
jgi:hypothetical protein